MKVFLSLLKLRRLILLFVGAISLALFLADDQAVADILFQSPASPPAQPAPVGIDPSEPQPPVDPSDAPLPVDPSGLPIPADPGAGQPPVSVEPAPDQPAETGPATEIVSPVSPLQQPGNQAPVLAPPPFPEPERTERREDEEVESEGSLNLVLDRAEFIDSVIVSTAYVWLCCGIVLFLLIPLAFIFLQIRGRMKLIEEENY